MALNILALFPGWYSNPYINMLSLAPRGGGWDVRLPKTYNAAISELKSLRHGDVFHIHRLSPIFEPGVSQSEASQRIAEFLGTAKRAVRNGVRVLWTVHNVISHESKYPDLETVLSRELSNIAHRIIQLNELTRDISREYYELDASKMITLPHSSYLGIYPDEVSRSDARAYLGISEDEAVVGFIGQIRRYKGVFRLISAMPAVQKVHQRARLVLAGRIADDERRKLVQSLDGAQVPYLLHEGFVADRDLQYWFKAADCVVFPYERVLNSGSAYLAATFGTPCVLPRDPQFSDLFVDENWVHLFDREGGPAQLGRAIAAAVAAPPMVRECARRFAARNSPYRMSVDYLEILHQL